MFNKISIVLPVYNECKNLTILYKEIKISLKNIGIDHEIIFVDDGSKDGSYQELENISKLDKTVIVLKFRRNFGQTAAMDAGFKHATGDVIISLDSDLQNDPADFGRLLNKLNEGYDVVTGWRKNRKDSFSKKIISNMANLFRKCLTNEKINDAGCSLKAYRAECVKSLNLFGETHRYVTTLLTLKGYKIAEIPVRHRKRKFNKTKYNITRVIKGLFDLLFIKFWNGYSARPLHFFGFFALIQYLFAGILLIEQITILYIYSLKNYVIGPIFMTMVMLIITGTLSFFFGFIAEILIRTHYNHKSNYDIEKVIQNK